MIIEDTSREDITAYVPKGSKLAEKVAEVLDDATRDYSAKVTVSFQFAPGQHRMAYITDMQAGWIAQRNQNVSDL